MSDVTILTYLEDRTTKHRRVCVGEIEKYARVRHWWHCCFVSIVDFTPKRFDKMPFWGSKDKEEPEKYDVRSRYVFKEVLGT